MPLMIIEKKNHTAIFSRTFCFNLTEKNRKDLIYLEIIMKMWHLHENLDSFVQFLIGFVCHRGTTDKVHSKTRCRKKISFSDTCTNHVQMYNVNHVVEIQLCVEGEKNCIEHEYIMLVCILGGVN